MGDDLRQHLRQHLTDAMRARDKAAVAAIRSALAAVENAEAVVEDDPTSTTAATTSVHVAGAAAGVGATDVDRRELTDEDVVAVVVAEIARLDDAAAEYDALDRVDQAADLRRQAEVLRAHLPA